MIQPLVFTDFYKTDHRRQYPKGTEFVYSNFTARGSRIPEINYTVVFGVQYFIKEYLIKQFNEGFFDLPKEKVLYEYKRRLDTSLGKDSVDISHIEALHDLGYLPIKLKTLPEGTKCPLRVPCVTIQNTLPEFFWLTNFLETLISSVLWHPMTSATLASRYKTILKEYADKTSDMESFVDFQGHDFSMRGMSGMEAACMSGAGHLLSFVGTDTIPAIDFLEKYYCANSEKELIGCSVPATEHSVMSLGGDQNEIDTFKRLITEVYPKGIVSIVSDTWDYWKVLTEYLPALKQIIIDRGNSEQIADHIPNKVTIRPDSGDPVEIICGKADFNESEFSRALTPEEKGSIVILDEIFGSTINSKGYKQLNSCIGLIYGDSITLERAEEISNKLKEKGYASTNVVYGIGSYTYQYVTRDTFGFAMKATHGRVNGVDKPIYKNPKTDNGLKNSARGLLSVTEGNDGKLICKEGVTREEEENGLLDVVFLNGGLVKEVSLSEIRGRL
jgi:nicotinamide phosphoribosyltransferase